MTLPDRLAAALDEVGLDTPPDEIFSRSSGVFARDVECLGAKFHSPNPLILRNTHVSPDQRGETVLLCGTCADNLTVLQTLLLKHGGDLPWPVRREFGNLVRALALRGWDDYLSRRESA